MSYGGRKLGKNGHSFSHCFQLCHWEKEAESGAELSEAQVGLFPVSYKQTPAARIVAAARALTSSRPEAPAGRTACQRATGHQPRARVTRVDGAHAVLIANSLKSSPGYHSMGFT